MAKLAGGGGIALLRAIPALDTVKFGNPDQKTGVDTDRSTALITPRRSRNGPLMAADLRKRRPKLPLK